MLRFAGAPEEFLAMRQTYAASLAAISICGYIVGVGDRHSENFLLHPASGELIPIDFGCPPSHTWQKPQALPAKSPLVEVEAHCLGCSRCPVLAFS